MALKFVRHVLKPGDGGWRLVEVRTHVQSLVGQHDKRAPRLPGDGQGVRQIDVDSLQQGFGPLRFSSCGPASNTTRSLKVSRICAGHHIESKSWAKSGHWW